MKFQINVQFEQTIIRQSNGFAKRETDPIEPLPGLPPDDANPPYVTPPVPVCHKRSSLCSHRCANRTIS